MKKELLYLIFAILFAIFIKLLFGIGQSISPDIKQLQRICVDDDCIKIQHYETM